MSISLKLTNQPRLTVDYLTSPIDMVFCLCEVLFEDCLIHDAELILAEATCSPPLRITRSR
jgi:hypothetical protein